MQFHELLDKYINKSAETNVTLADKITALGRKISEGSIAKYRQGNRTPDPIMIELICEIININEQDLFPNAISKKEKIALEMIKKPSEKLISVMKQYAPTVGQNSVEIPLYCEAVAGAGEAFYPEYLEEASKVTVAKQFLNGVNPKYLMFFRIVGDSMKQTILPNDWVLIELVAGRHFSLIGGIYLIDVDGSIQIKRLEFNDGEGKNIDIISDNENIPNKNTKKDNLEIKIIGKLFMHMQQHGSLDTAGNGNS